MASKAGGPSFTQEGLTTLVIGEALSANEIRIELSNAALHLFIEGLVEGRELKPEEIDWAIKALEWIGWNPGKSGGKALIEGTALVAVRPYGQPD